jgi:hypothetical protein
LAGRLLKEQNYKKQNPQNLWFCTSLQKHNVKPQKILKTSW